MGWNSHVGADVVCVADADYPSDLLCPSGVTTYSVEPHSVVDV